MVDILVLLTFKITR